MQLTVPCAPPLSPLRLCRRAEEDRLPGEMAKLVDVGAPIASFQLRRIREQPDFELPLRAASAGSAADSRRASIDDETSASGALLQGLWDRDGGSDISDDENDTGGAGDGRAGRSGPKSEAERRRKQAMAAVRRAAQQESKRVPLVKRQRQQLKEQMATVASSMYAITALELAGEGEVCVFGIQVVPVQGASQGQNGEFVSLALNQRRPSLTQLAAAFLPSKS